MKKGNRREPTKTGAPQRGEEGRESIKKGRDECSVASNGGRPMQGGKVLKNNEGFCAVLDKEGGRTGKVAFSPISD